MANLNDTPQWTDVYQLEQSDPVVGGAPNPATGAGMDNIPHLQLAQRTSWLKNAVTLLQAATGSATAAVAGIVKLSGATNSTATDTAASSAAVKAANDNAETRALKSTIISAGGLATGGGDLSASRTITVPVATQAQAEAMLLDTVAMTPLQTGRAIAAMPAGTVTTAKLADNAVTAAKIADGVVSNAKLANVATATLKGRVTAGTGAVEDLTPAQALSVMGITASGAQVNAGLFYTSATAPSGPVEGSRWRDTSVPSAPVDKIYRLGAWVTEIVDLGITATPAQINPLALAFDNAFVGAGITSNLARGANDFGRWYAGGTVTGVTLTRVGFGIDTDGRPYVDYSVTGTATGTTVFSPFDIQNSATPAVAGQVFTGSLHAQIVAGTVPANTDTGVRIDVRGQNASGVETEAYFFGPTRPAVQTLSTLTATLVNAATAQITCGVTLRVASGISVDFTVRIKGLQFDQGAARLAYPFKALSAPQAQQSLGFNAFDNAFLGAGVTGNLANGAADFSNTAFWSPSGGQNGVTVTRVAVGVDNNGVRFADYAVSGTATDTSLVTTHIAAASRISAVSGQTFTTSFFAQVIAGTPPSPSSGIRPEVVGETAGMIPTETFVANVSRFTSETLASVTGTLAVAGSVVARCAAIIRTASGETVNYTVRIKGLQFDRGPNRLVYPFKAMSAAEARVSMGVDPAGGIQFFAMNTAPAGWLKANGALVSRTTYAALFAAIGTTWGAGDGSTTFALPDLRGEFLRGWDDGRGVDSGRAFGSAQSSQNLSHSHGGATSNAGAHIHTAWTDSQGSHTHSVIVYKANDFNSGVYVSGTDDVYDGGAWVNPTSPAGNHTHNVGIGSAGDHSHSIAADGGAEARPRNIALLACIKF